MKTVQIKLLVNRTVWSIIDGKTAFIKAKKNDIIEVTADNAKILIDAKQAETSLTKDKE